MERRPAIAVLQMLAMDGEGRWSRNSASQAMLGPQLSPELFALGRAKLVHAREPQKYVELHVNQHSQ